MDAANGSQDALLGLTRLGVSLADLQALSSDKRFELLADRLAAIKNPLLQGAMAAQVFGSAGEDLIPFLQEGPGAMARLRDEARKLGLVMSDEDAAAAGELSVAFGMLTQSVTAAFDKIGAAVAPVLNEALNAITNVVSAGGKWLDQNREIVQTALKLAAGVGAVGAALLTTGVTIKAAAAVVGSLATAWTAVGTVVGTIGAAFAALATPVGLAVAGMAALSAAFIDWQSIASESIQWVSETFGTFVKDAQSAWGGLVNAITAGDMQAAFEVVTSFFQLQWTRAMNSVSRLWEEGKAFF
jgi:hypothetical protein